MEYVKRMPEQAHAGMQAGIVGAAGPAAAAATAVQLSAADPFHFEAYSLERATAMDAAAAAAAVRSISGTYYKLPTSPACFLQHFSLNLN